MKQTRYALCGASGRGSYYALTICRDYQKTASLAGIFDINPMRADYVRAESEKELPAGHAPIPVYMDFDKMITETKPDCVLVITMDSAHAEYVVKSLDAGLDVICEKPMTIDADGVTAILDAEKRAGKKITVIFNARWQSSRERIKELMQSGVIGRVLSVDFEWLLDRVHGADYFRRWHKWLRNSGGLLVTKATHHFDLVNWWTEREPERVFANGSLDFYGPSRDKRAERCSTCPYTRDCGLAMKGFDDAHGQTEDMEWLRRMYFEPETLDGYMRDQCVFAQCDIWDNMSLAVKYGGGMLMTYSLNAFAPYEGFRIALNGDKGRMEYDEIHRGIGDGERSETIRVYYPGSRLDTYSIPKDTGVHGGSDSKLFDRLFAGIGADREDPLHRLAGALDGARSVLLGAAANISIKTGEPVLISGLVDLDRYR
jgi:predicted dehydrogenase